MKKIIILGLIMLLLISCSSVNAAKETATYLESVDEFGTFESIKLVDKETGCKYLVINAPSSGRNSVIQMLDKDGKPLCK